MGGKSRTVSWNKKDQQSSERHINQKRKQFKKKLRQEQKKKAYNGFMAASIEIKKKL